MAKKHKKSAAILATATSKLAGRKFGSIADFSAAVNEEYDKLHKR